MSVPFCLSYSLPLFLCPFPSLPHSSPDSSSCCYAVLSVSTERCVAPCVPPGSLSRTLYVGCWPFPSASRNLAAPLIGGIWQGRCYSDSFDFEFLPFGCYMALISGTGPAKDLMILFIYFFFILKVRGVRHY